MNPYPTAIAIIMKFSFEWSTELNCINKNDTLLLSENSIKDFNGILHARLEHSSIISFRAPVGGGKGRETSKMKGSDD